MTSHAAPPPLSTVNAAPATDDLPPVPTGAGPRRGALAGATTALVITAGATVFSAVMLVRPAPAALHTVIVPPPAPAYSAAEVAAASERACAAWSVAGEAMARASSAAADAPRSWDDPLTRDAHGYEARTALIESEYLASQVEPAARPELAGAIHDYLVATLDQEDATMHKMGTQVDAAVDRGNTAVDRVNAACGLA
jgi:hypothetical protein